MKNCIYGEISSRGGVKPNLLQIKGHPLIKINPIKPIRPTLALITPILRIKFKDLMLVQAINPLLSYIHVRFAGNLSAITST